jgi:hypothetical protein
MTIEQVIRDLHDSEINGQIGWSYDGVWWVKLGDSINGYDAEGRCAYPDETAELLRRMAVKHYPHSAFAKKYRKDFE